MNTNTEKLDIFNDQNKRKLGLLPYSAEAERNVLGALISRGKDAWDKICDIVMPSDFYEPSHQTLFKILADRLKTNQHVDAISIFAVIKAQKKIKQIGDLDYLSELAITANSAHITAHAKIVHSKSLLRKLITTCNELADEAINYAGDEVSEMLDEAERRILEIEKISQYNNDSFKSISDLLLQFVDSVNETYMRNQDGETAEITTGFLDLDKMTQGLQRGDLIIVAGRPSMGKTAFALNIAEYVAVRKELPVAIFSMEMSGLQLAMRMVASISRVKATNIRTGNLSDDDWHNLTTGLDVLSKKQIYIDETPTLTPLSLRAKIRRLIQKMPDDKKLGLIIIDYLQLMTGNRSNSDNRATEVSEISRAIKVLARELNVPIIALSQLSRQVETRQDKRPMMSDLRESGAIEQDADVILMMYRAEYYERKIMEANGEPLDDFPSPNAGKAEVIIGKQRNGPTGTVNLTFLSDIVRFENAANDTNNF